MRKLEEELFKHRLKKNTNQLENTMLIRNARRDIARVNTVLAERLRARAAEKRRSQDVDAAKEKRNRGRRPSRPTTDRTARPRSRAAS